MFNDFRFSFADLFGPLLPPT